MIGCIIALALFTGAYTIAGGLRAVVWTEMFQLVVLLTGGLVLTFVTLQVFGGGSANVWHGSGAFVHDVAAGWSNFAATSGEWHLMLPATDADFPWTMYLGGLLCVSIFYCAANQFIVQRTAGGQNEWHARMGVIFTDYLKLVLPLIIFVPGMCGHRLFPNLGKRRHDFPKLVTTLLPRGLVGLVMAGLVAATMSHLSAQSIPAPPF